MKTISVQAGAFRYDALVGSDLLPTIGARLARLLRGPACAIIADGNTAPLFAATIIESLSQAGFKPVLITIPPGESSKSLAQAGEICEQMGTAGLDRTSLVVAVGGGVVGDLAGFAASIYHRGIPFVQVPTTLLAQVDSSVGGKTAVNTARGKNLLGTFYQPALVLADVNTLRTLPVREWNQGFAEIIKHGIVADASLLEEAAQLSSSPARDARKAGSERLARLIHRNIEIKAGIVARDERDVSGERAILNFGHTVGHAIERAAGYSRLLHGEAVSLGIVVACDVSVRHAGLAEADRKKVIAALEAFDLPTTLPPDFPRDAILAALQGDKKFERGQVRFVVTPGLGSAYLTSEVTLDEIRAVIATL